MQHSQANIAYESVLEVHYNLFELCCLWHVLSKRENLLSYLFLKFMQEGEYTISQLEGEFNMKKGDSCR